MQHLKMRQRPSPVPFVIPKQNPKLLADTGPPWYTWRELSSHAGHFEFDSIHKILLVVVEGDIEDPEVLLAKDRIANQVRRLQPAAGITDLSAVRRFDVSSEAMRTAARQPSPYPDNVSSFIVAPADLVFGLARMYELIGSSARANLKVVHTRQEALADLGVREPRFEWVD